MAEKLKSKMNLAVKSASLNMILQVCFRIGTFLMNAVLLRHISRELLGLVNVRLTLLYNTILFISREPFRKSCLSQIEGSSDKNANKKKQLVNITWLTVIVGAFTSVVLSFVWINFLEQPSAEFSNGYKSACLMFALTAFIELMVEPLWIFGQRSGLVTLKVVLEGCLLFIRCCLSILFVVMWPQFGIFSFPVAFIISSICYVALYYLYFKGTLLKGNHCFGLQSFGEILPNFHVTPMFDKNYTDLALSFYKQSLLKQFLTEGERYIMTLFRVLSLSQQGVYDVINNLGSLAARFIFMPIEESYYIYFSQLLKRGDRHASKESLKQCNDTLTLILKFVSLVSSIIIVFGFSYSKLLLFIYGGNILSEGEGPVLLQTYCAYVMFLAINGITECFMFASMDQREVEKYNYKMLSFSIVFTVASLVFTKFFGSVGFIIANCLNMGLRIWQSSIYILDFFNSTEFKPLNAVFPHVVVCLSLAASFVITFISERMFGDTDNLKKCVIHVIIGAVSLLFVLLTVYIKEKDLVNILIGLFKKEKFKE